MKPFLILMLAVAIATGAQARPKAKGKGAKRGQKAAAKPESSESSATRRVATQKFSGLKLKGQLKKPDLSYIYKRKGLRADQVVDVPEDFNREIIDSSLSF